MSRDSLSLYVARGKRYFGLILSVVLLLLMNPFSIDSALGQGEESGDGDSGPTAEQMAAWEEEAKEYADKGKYDQAIAIYNSILSQYPGTDAAQQAWTWAAQMYIRSGNSAAAESAIQVLQTEFAQHSETAKSLCLIGKTYYQNGMAANANALHQYNVDNFPDSKYAMWSQVEIVSFHLDNKDLANAGSAMETMLSRFSQQEALPLGIYLVAGRFQKAGAEAKALELHQYNVDNFPDSQRAVLSQVDIICSYLSNQDFSNAESATETLYSRFAEHEALPEGIYMLANYYFRQMGDKAKGLELHLYNVDNFPDSQHAMMSQGIITKDYLSRGDFDNAESAMEKFLSRFAGQEELPREVYKIAKYYYARADRQDKAIELYQYMATTWPEDDYALLSLKEEAISRIKRYQMVEAQEVIEILLTSFSEHKKLAQALNGIANAYHQVQDDEKALEYYQYVLANYPVNETTLEARKGTAIAYIGLGQDEKVDAAVETLLTDFADYSDLSRAVFIIGEEYYGIAMGMVKQVDTEAAAENFAKALPIWQKIVAELPESEYAPHAHYFVAVCHRRLLQFPQAVEHWQKVVDNWPNFMYAGSAQSLVGAYTKVMRNSGEIPAEEADPLIQFAYENVIENYNKGPYPYVYRYALGELGRFHMEKSQWPEVTMYFETFRMEFPDFKYTGWILDNLIRAYESMGEPAIAIDVCEEFIQYCPDDRRIERVRAKLEELTGEN